jgi:hypothetical protein
MIAAGVARSPSACAVMVQRLSPAATTCRPAAAGVGPAGDGRAVVGGVATGPGVPPAGSAADGDAGADDGGRAVTAALDPPPPGALAP